jgi:branched-chain amino acid transport system permease protein
LAIVPLFKGDDYTMDIFITAFTYCALVASFDLLLGYTGVVSFATDSFFGFAAYSSALLVMRVNMSPFISLIFAGAMAGLLGVILSFPCIRMRGLWGSAIVTIGASKMLQTIAANWTDLTRGYLSLWGIPTFPTIKIFNTTIDFAKKMPNYYLIYIIMGLICVAVYGITKSDIGLLLKATREDYQAAESLGVNTNKYKIFAFALSGFMTGVVGAFQAHYLTVVSPDIFNLSLTVQVIAYQIIGGSGTLVGPVMIAFMMTFIFEFLRVAGLVRDILFGILIFGFVIFLPSGLYPQLTKLRAWLTEPELKSKD